jgi:hypothetical protein
LKFTVALGSQPEDPTFDDESMVNPLEQATTCSCGQRIRSAHFLIILDLMDSRYYDMAGTLHFEVVDSESTVWNY